MTAGDEVVARERAAREYSARVMDRQDAALVAAWSRVWRELEPEFMEAISEVMDNSRTGRVSASTFAKSRRLSQALEQAHNRVEDMLKEYGYNVEQTLPDLVSETVQAHKDMVAAQLPEPGTPGMTVTYTNLNRGALEAIVSRSLKRITSDHLTLPADVEGAMRSELIRGIAVGDNPRSTARKIVSKAGSRFKGGYARAQMISRTEMLDAQRTGARSWESLNSDVVDKWVWTATLDARCCSSCVSMHGQEFPISEPGPEDHHNGRCARVPKTKSWEELGIHGVEDTSVRMQTGEEWYNDQDYATQVQTVGRRRAELLSNGDISFSDLSSVKKNSNWRDYRVPTSLRTLEGYKK